MRVCLSAKQIVRHTINARNSVLKSRLLHQGDGVPHNSVFHGVTQPNLTLRCVMENDSHGGDEVGNPPLALQTIFELYTRGLLERFDVVFGGDGEYPRVQLQEVWIVCCRVWQCRFGLRLRLRGLERASPQPCLFLSFLSLADIPAMDSVGVETPSEPAAWSSMLLSPHPTSGAGKIGSDSGS